jgi:hypothetical protein
MTEARVEYLYPAAGSVLKTGDKLLDVSIDLSSAFSQDCPPITFYRIILRENAVLRKLVPAQGQCCKVGELIAVFTTVPDEAADQPAQRGVRFATAGIMHHSGMWTGKVA